MSNISICLVCLCRGINMYNYDDYNLSLYYKEIMPHEDMDGLPHHFCYLCAAMLYKFHKFKEKCQTGRRTLHELMANGPITSTSISEVDRESKHLQSTINAMTKSKRVKTYVVEDKSIDYVNIEETFENSTDSDSDNSLVYRNMAEVEIEIDDEELDYSEKKVNIDELKINVDEQKTNVDKNKVKSDIQKSNIEISHLNDNRSLNEDVKPQQHYPNFALHMRQIVETAFNNELINNDIIVVEEKVNSGEKKKPKRDITGKRKRKKAQDMAKVEKKEKIKENKQISSSKKVPAPKSKELSPEHWVKITMSEEEAMEKFKARANNPKYISAEFKCSGCYKAFSREDILTRHVKLVHCESRGPHVCEFCTRRFKTMGLVKKHKRVHYDEFKCLRCNLVFHLECAAVRHDDLHGGTVKSCEQCGLQFRHLTTYYSHLRVYHRSEHVCTLCGASFVSHKGLLQHKNLKHKNVEINPEEGEGKYCDKCDMKFETRRAYEEHFNESVKHADIVVPKGDKKDEDTDEESDNNLPLALVSLKGKITNPNPHLNNQNKSRGTKTCCICEKVFPSYNAYRLHHRSEHRDVPIPVAYTLICDVCGITVKSNNIAHHMNIHTRSKLFPCPTCGVQFTLKANMLRHNLTHTVKDRSEYQFKCPLCEKRFTQKGSMQLHYRTIHLKEPYPKRNRKKKTCSQDISGFIAGNSD